MKTYKKILFEGLLPEQKDILIALLSEMKFEGIEETASALTIYFSDELFDENAVKEIAAQLNLNFSVDAIEDRNWNQQWESGFEPVIVDDFAIVRAVFHSPQPGIKHDIIITPKMSFGTGHHATTYMMMQQMKEIDFTGKRVLDFGTGTGVLAILAEKLGASYVKAIDNDDWSIENAKENLQVNNCSITELEKNDTAKTNQEYDIILANIIRSVILDNFENFSNSLKTNNILVLSGLLISDEEAILQAAFSFKFRLQRRFEKGEWISLCLIKM